VPQARDAVERAGAQRGWQVERIQDTDTFCRLQINGMDEVLIVDLAVDVAPRHGTITTDLGPSFTPEELAGRKTVALFDRAEARDFTDVYLLAQRFGREELLTRAAEIDNGFDTGVLATMMRSLSRLTDDELPVQDIDVAQLRAFFIDWARELDEPTS
jgi:hypothetical protein